MELFKIIRGIEEPFVPAETQPAHVLLDGFHILHLLLAGIGVVEAQVAEAPVIGGNPEIDTDGFGMADVQVAVGFGRETGMDAALEFACF